MSLKVHTLNGRKKLAVEIQKRKTRKGVINATIKLLSNKNNWTKGADAIDKYGNDVRPQDPNAEKFCVRGAIRACSASPEVFRDTYHCLARITGINGIVNTNDTFGYDAVMAVLEKGKTECK